jgi:nuclear transport factor 2 (NTF2) superfamily protein
MKTKTINVYEFKELSEEAKQRALDKCRQTEDFWSGENGDTLKAFCELFSCRISRNGIEYRGSVEVTGQRLATYIYNTYKSSIYKPKQYWICEGRPNTVGANSKHRNSNIFLDEFGCVFTGFYMDNEILAPIFDFMRKPDKHKEYQELMNDCYHAYEVAVEKDWEYQVSDENTIESIKANNYEFDEEGNLI